MDGDIEKLHSLLIDADLPSSISDLKNPTTDFIVKLLNTFLTHFSIDVHQIQRPTYQQLEGLSYPEISYDMISILNLYLATASIGSHIFINDLCITDITSPGPKRTRKQIGLLTNFLLYANNKKLDLQASENEILLQAHTLQELCEKKRAVMEEINEKALRNSKLQALKTKNDTQIQEIRLRIEELENSREKQMELIKYAEKRKHEAKQRMGSFKAQFLKMNQITTELESKVVNSPNKYTNRLKELEEKCKVMEEKRETLLDAGKCKRQMIKQMEDTMTLVKNQHEMYSEVKDIYKRSKEADKKFKDSAKQIEETDLEINELKHELEKHNGQNDVTEIEECKAHCEKTLSPLYSMHARLRSDKELLERRLEEERKHLQEMSLKRDEIYSKIAKVEEDIEIFCRDCQNKFDEEMAGEIELQAIIKAELSI